MIDHNQILALIDQYEKNSYGQNDQALADEREEALDRFYGRPYGDEVDGRSQVVSQDTRDTVLWVMPQLMKIFAAGDEIVKFSPKTAQDVEPAEQETAYINHVVLEKNRGFEILYNWFFDALLSKVGYVKVYWEDYTETERETYKELSGEEAALLLQNQDIQIVGHEEFIDEFGRDYHTLVIEVTSMGGCVKVCNIPPENMMVDYGVTGTCLQDADFVEERSTVSIGELRAQGFDVADDVAGDDEMSYDIETLARDRYDEYSSDDWQTGSLRKVTLREVYLKLDDGGIKLHRVLVAGKTVLEVEEAECVPYASLCPVPMPHRHVGLSYADIVMDLERIKTQLLRNALDAQYLAIHGRHAINKDKVNLEDMLVSRAGGLVRVDGDPAGAIMPLYNPVDGSSSLQAMEYIDKIRETRTGVSERTQGIGEDALQETATATAKLMTAAMERIYMIARIFAETGVKDLFLLTHGLVRRHSNKEAIFELRNKWVAVDPRTWKTRKDMTVSVGLGTGDKEEMRVHLMTILSAQKEAAAIGLATPKNIYNALAKLTQNAGFKNVDEFWTDPDNVQQQQPQPDPEIVKAQMELQFKREESQAKMQLERERIAGEMILKERELESEIQLKRESMAAEAQVALLKENSRQKIDTQVGIE